MYTRSAVFEGRILPGKEEEFYTAVQERLLPAWRQMLHATDVRLYQPVGRDDFTPEVFLVQEIDYPSLDAIDEALGVGHLTPPFGELLFTTAYAGNIPIEKILKKVPPYIILLLAINILVTFVPEFVLFFPRVVFGMIP